MSTNNSAPSSAIAPLALAWLALLALTFLSLRLGEWFDHDIGLHAAVALVIWLKGALVARHFIEAHLAHRFIRRVLYVFIGFAPLALLLIGLFGETVAGWTRL
jgi:hypothetical protein